MYSVKELINKFFNNVLQILLKYAEIEAVYCFGFQSRSLKEQRVFGAAFCQKEKQWEFSLLLIGKNIPVNATANLADLVAQQCEGKIKLTLLCYSLKKSLGFYWSSFLFVGMLLHRSGPKA